jgi:pyrroloquinoline quinone biosynthesis protein D
VAEPSKRILIGVDSIPRFAPHVRFRFDKKRERWVVLAPERLLMPDEIAVEILRCCDGIKTVGTIADELCQRFDAPADVVGRDVIDMLQGLTDKGFMEA